MSCNEIPEEDTNGQRSTRRNMDDVGRSAAESREAESST